MRRTVKNILVVCALASGLLAASGEARAQANGYGLVTINNPLNGTIHYQFKWGQNSEWVSYSLAAKHSRWHSYALAADATAPRPYIQFDYILNDGQVTYKSYHLQFCASARQGSEFGKWYDFRVSGCGCYLDLYAR